MESIAMTREMVDRLIPRRAPETHKDHYGRVLAVCGSVGYTGAAYFAASAAVRTGSGVVTLAVPEAVYGILAGKLSEPVVRPLPCDAEGKLIPAAAEVLAPTLARADALLVGCGLGQSEPVRQTVFALLRQARCPVVCDADGINLLAGHIDILREMHAPLILTPHGGEFARLSGFRQAGEQEAHDFAVQNGVTLLLKRHQTLIAAPDGRLWHNTTGNPGMAKGGSGDVLAGMILSLLGQGLAPAEAACAGAWLHGKAGDECANRLGEYGMTPSDMLCEIPQVLKRYNTREW